MCGITGVAIPRNGTRNLDEDRLVRMRDQLVHRGPDDAGLFLDEGIGLAHRRLSIVDVAHGHQPMWTADQEAVVVYNGEVFNHPSLKVSLEKVGVRYATNCDTETILHLFQRHGVDFAEQCRGMFAIALWQPHERKLMLVRDRFGVKPLYYCLLPDGTLIFASEIKAILASGWLQPALNQRALPDLLANYAPSGEETLYEGVRRLPPGCRLEWHEGRISIQRYWDLRFSPVHDEDRPESSVVAEFRERLSEAVRLRLMADVPLGAFLSGGIDSAAITALMAEHVGPGIKTFSVAFADRSANEFEYARMVASAFKTEHHEVVLGEEEFWRLLPTMTWHEDEPIAHPSSIALYAVARLASQHVKVVLTGEGSDEMLAGYNRYRVGLVNARLAGPWSRLVPASIRDAFHSRIGEPSSAGWKGKLSRTSIGRGTKIEDFYFDNFAVFTRSMLERLLVASASRQEIASVYATHTGLMASSDASGLLGRMLYADTRTYLHELLMKQDQMSMAASIESRVPFLDHEFASWVATLPERHKLHGWSTKHILRRSMKDTLPPVILSRKKMGFPVPIGAWLRGRWRFLLDEFVLSDRVLSRGFFEPSVVRAYVEAHDRSGTHGSRLWALLNFEVWYRGAFEGEGAPELSRLMVQSAAA